MREIEAETSLGGFFYSLSVLCCCECVGLGEGMQSNERE